MGYDDTLTGNIRYRVATVGFLPRQQVVILQVEVGRPDGPPDANGMPLWTSCRTWRDAQPTDIYALGKATP